MTNEVSDPQEVPPSDSVKELPQINEIKNEETNDEDSSNEGDSQAKKRKKGPAPGKKPSAEVLQRRKEGRRKAAATIANNIKKTGIGRFEEQNGFTLTSVKQIPLINQKNYYTDYLKKDEQVSFIRNWRTEKLLAQKLKNLKKDELKKDDSDTNEAKNFDNFNLNDIETEMNKKKSATTLVEEEEEEEEEEDENENEEISEEKARLGFDTIIIHPGSSNIRIGRATDAFPKTVPTVIAVPNTNKHKQTDKTVPTPVRTVNDEGQVFFNEEFDEVKENVTKDFKARMRYYKRRMLPNSRETAANYNKRQEPEMIPDHNDPMKKEWIDLKDPKYNKKKFFVGEEALSLPICEKFTDWKLRFPVINGRFNESSDDYESCQEILGDLSNIIVESLSDLDIKKPQLANLKAILIIPDLYDKMQVETWCDLLFRQVGFGRIGIIQESVLATFGAGATSACVVDVGSQTTSIACVDEGMVINDSRIVLNYGGDNVTETFIKLLLQSQFPYKDINLSSRNEDWELAQTLKHNFITFQDADIAVQLYHFYQRKPYETTKKYEFKVFDEVMLAPLGLFYPDLFQIDKTAHDSNKLFSPSVDQYSGKPNNPYSKSQENIMNKFVHSDLTDEALLNRILDERNDMKSANPYSKPKPTRTSATEDPHLNCSTPLEKAIIESITNAGVVSDFSKTKKFYDNLLIVGGGFAKVSGFDLVLSDRINIWRPKFLSSSTLDEMLDYVSTERLKVDASRSQLIADYKDRKKGPDQALDDVELTDDEMAEIDSQTQLTLDLDHIDSISDKGSALPVNVLPPPREFDPEMLTWKGGSVYGRLKVVNEMWVTQKDWDLLQSRCLYYKSLFNY